jgi:hypothetical protein
MRPAAAGRPWIWLSVVMHELGHVLGFDHDDAGAIPVMNGTLDAGAHYQLGTAWKHRRVIGSRRFLHRRTLHSSSSNQQYGAKIARCRHGATLIVMRTGPACRPDVTLDGEWVANGRDCGGYGNDGSPSAPATTAFSAMAAGSTPIACPAPMATL